MKKIVVIGGGAAGTSAAMAARKQDRTAEITVVHREKVPEYSRCGLPYVISGVISEFENLVIHPVDFYEKMMRIRLLLGKEVTDVSGNEVILDDGARLAWDSLIIATGGGAVTLPAPGFSKVFTLRTIEDGRSIAAEAKKGKKAAIVGAGLVGMELADAFVKLGVDTSVVELMPEILPLLDKDMAEPVRKKAEGEGVKFFLGKKLEDTGGLKGDFAVISVGVRADTTLAKKMGLDVNRGIVVNDKMETSKPRVYAAGDCAEFPGGRPIQLGTIAVRSGRVAGANAAGGDAKAVRFHAAGMTTLFGIEASVVGLTETEAASKGIPIVVGKSSGGSKPEYYPGGHQIQVKLIASPEGKLLGAQVIGDAQRINSLSLAIEKGCSLQDLAGWETGYAPPLAPVIDPIAVAAEAALLRISRSRRAN